MAEVAVRSRRDAVDNPFAQLKGEFEVEKLLGEPHWVSPLRRHDCPPISDGAAALVLAAGDAARQGRNRPAWIRGIDHRIEPQSLGVRDLTVSTSTRLAAEKAGVASGKVDLAELYAPFTHQEPVLGEALGLGDDVVVNPSGGVLAGPVQLGQTSGFTSSEVGGLQDAEQRVLGNLAEGLLLELLVDLEAERARTGVPGASGSP